MFEIDSEDIDICAFRWMMLNAFHNALLLRNRMDFNPLVKYRLHPNRGQRRLPLSIHAMPHHDCTLLEDNSSKFLRKV
jgi:hypothetical protein